MSQPTAFTWDARAGAMRAKWPKLAASRYEDGGDYLLAPVEPRSAATHRHFFAAVNEAWANLPEHLAAEYPTPEHLRKRALIQAGFCTMRDYTCATKAEAVRWAKNLRAEADEYAVVIVSEAVVRVIEAQSQSVKAMGKETFQRSKDAVFNALAQMIGVRTEELHRAANDSHAPRDAA